MKFKKILFVVLFSFFTILFFGCAKNFKISLLNVKVVNSNVNTEKIKKNTKLDFEIIKKEGHIFKDLVINGENKTGIVKDYKFSYTVDKNLNIEAKFEKEEKTPDPVDKFYKLELENVSLLTKNINPDKVKENTKLDFSISVPENKKLIGLLINGEEKKDIVKDNKFSLQMDKDYKIKAIFKDIEKINYFNVDVKGAKLLTSNIDLLKVEENTKLDFELVIPSDKVFEKLIIDGVDKKDIVKDNKFSVIVDKNKKIEAIYRDYYYYSLDLSGVKLSDTTLNKDKIKENTDVEFVLDVPKNNKLSKLIINNVEQDLGIVKDNKFNYKIEKNTKIEAIYEFDVSLNLKYNDNDLNNENNTEIYKGEEFTFNFIGLTPNDIKVKTSQNLSYKLDLPNQKITIDPFNEVREEVIEAEFYYDEGNVVKKFKLNVLKNDLLDDKAKLEALHNGYKVLDGMYDKVFNSDFELIKTYVEALSQVVSYADNLNSYLPILKPLNMTVLSKFIEYSNPNDDYIKKYVYIKFFLKDKFYDINILPQAERLEIVRIYNEMNNAHSSIKDFLYNLSQFNEKYLTKDSSGNVVSSLVEKLKAFQEYHKYYEELLKLKEEFNLLKEIVELKDEFDAKNFQKNSDYLLYLSTAGSDDKLVKLRKSVFEKGETNPKTNIKNIKMENLSNVIKDLLDVAKTFREKVVPSGDLDINYLNKNIEGVYNFAQYFVQYIAILQKNNQVVSDKNYFILGKPRGRVSELFTQIFQTPAEPTKKDDESDEDFKERYEAWQEIAYNKADITINVIKSYCEKSNIDKTKEIAKSFYLNIDKLIEEVDVEGGQKVFNLLKRLNERNNIIAEIQSKI